MGGSYQSKPYTKMVDSVLLKCSVCAKKLQKSEQTSAAQCSHYLCATCLAKLTMSDGRLECPFCRHSEQLPSKRKPTWSYKKYNKDTRCDACQVDFILGMQWCEVCEFRLCSKCVIGHGKLPQTKKHTIVPLALNGFQDDKFVGDHTAKYSNRSPTVDGKFYCRTCKVILKGEAILTHISQSHTIVGITEIRQQLVSAMDSIGKVERNISENIDTMAELVKALDGSSEEEKLHIKERVKNSCNTIQAEGNYLLQELDVFYKDEKEMLNRMITVAERENEKLRHQQKRLMSAIDNPAEAELVLSDLPLEKVLFQARKVVKKLPNRQTPLLVMNIEMPKERQIGVLVSPLWLTLVQTNLTRKTKVGECIVAEIKTIRDCSGITYRTIPVNIDVQIKLTNGECINVSEENVTTHTDTSGISLSIKCHIVGEYKVSATIHDCHIQHSPLMVDVTNLEFVKSYCFGGKECSTPLGLAINIDRQIAVVSQACNKVKIYNGREFLTSLPENDEDTSISRWLFYRPKFKQPRAIAISKANIYHITNAGQSAVFVCDENGKLIACFGEGELNDPRGISLNSKGDKIYVADYSSHRICVYCANTHAYLFSFGKGGSKDGELRFPEYITINSTGCVIVSDSGNHRIQVFSELGCHLLSFGKMGCRDTEMKSPGGVATDKFNNIYVCERENQRIQIFDENGRFLNKITIGTDTEFFPSGIAISDDGEVFVADGATQKIIVFQ